MHEANQNQSPLVDVLLARHGGQLIIPFIDAASSIGYPQQTARNELTRGTFPVPTLRRGGRRFVAITDLAEYLDKLYSQRDTLQQPPRKKGRPTKAEQVAKNS